MYSSVAVFLLSFLCMSSNQFRPTVEKWTRTLRSREKCNFFWAPNKDWIACSHKNHPCYLQWKLFMHIYVTSQTKLDWMHSFWNSDENLMHRRLCLICAIFFYSILCFPTKAANVLISEYGIFIIESFLTSFSKSI